MNWVYGSAVPLVPADMDKSRGLTWMAFGSTQTKRWKMALEKTLSKVYLTLIFPSTTRLKGSQHFRSRWRCIHYFVLKLVRVSSLNAQIMPTLKASGVGPNARCKK